MWRQCIQILEFGKVRKLLSLYAATPLGKEGALALEPFDDLYAIDQALELTTEMKRAITAGLHLPLDDIRDIHRPVERARAGGGPLMPDELWSISVSAKAANNIGRALSLLVREEYQNLRRLGARIPRLDDLSDDIINAVDASGIIRDSASPELSAIRHRLAEIRRRLHDRLQSIINSPSQRSNLQYPNYTVMRNRYVLPVVAQSRGDIAGIVHGHSDSGATLYIEPDSIVGMGNELADLQSEEENEEKRICWRLTRKVGEHAADIMKALEIVTAIDVASAKAHFSIDYQMTEPKVVDETVLDLRKARHPLLLYLHSKNAAGPGKAAGSRRPESPDVESVVATDLHLGDDFSVLIVTGPNTGGKTVTLKCVGLLCLMARAGMHVTAEHAQIPFYDFIYADIGDEQSLEQSLSTFSSHLSHIVEFLTHATDRGLVLLDELGAGTDPIEGAALGRVVVEALAARGTSTIVTTHLGELKQLGYTLGGVENSCMQFDVRTLKPTYQLTIGTPGKSNALEIAHNMGFPEDLLALARQRTSQLQVESTEKVMAQLQHTREEAEERLNRARDAESEAAALKAEYDAMLAKLKDEEMRKGARWALETRDKLEELAAKAHHLYDEFRFSHKSAGRELREMSAALKELHRRLADAIGEYSPARTVEPGDEVYVPRLHRWATVVRLKKQHGTVIVSYGQATAELPVTEVMLWENLSQHGELK